MKTRSEVKLGKFNYIFGNSHLIFNPGTKSLKQAVEDERLLSEDFKSKSTPRELTPKG